MSLSSGFVPPNCFDAHAHLYRSDDSSDGLPPGIEEDHGHVGWKTWQKALRQWMGDSVPTGGLFFTNPKPGLQRPEANQFLADEVESRSNSRALMLIHPQDDPAGVEAEVESKGFVGFKVYHVYADRKDTFNAECQEFLPDWAWEIAGKRNLAITLHMVRSRAMADPLNQKYIRDYCLQYPGARLILAHAARGFCAAHTVEGIASLRGLDNVYFDTSAICESAAFEAILK